MIFNLVRDFLHLRWQFIKQKILKINITSMKKMKHIFIDEKGFVKQINLKIR